MISAATAPVTGSGPNAPVPAKPPTSTTPPSRTGAATRNRFDGRSARNANASTGTITTCTASRTVAMPAPTRGIASPQSTKSRPSPAPASSGKSTRRRVSGPALRRSHQASANSTGSESRHRQNALVAPLVCETLMKTDDSAMQKLPSAASRRGSTRWVKVVLTGRGAVVVTPPAWASRLSRTSECFCAESGSITTVFGLERMRALHALATQGSVAAAAASLHVTPSGVSQQLAKLEREAGQPLLESRGRGVRLTKAGQVLAGHAERILAQVAEAKTDLELLREDVIGPLRVGAIPTTVHALLPPALATLAVQHPRLEVTLHEGEAEQTMPRVLAA